MHHAGGDAAEEATSGGGRSEGQERKKYKPTLQIAFFHADKCSIINVMGKKVTGLNSASSKDVFIKATQ